MNVGLYTEEEFFKLLTVFGKMARSFCRTVAGTELCFA